MDKVARLMCSSALPVLAGSAVVWPEAGLIHTFNEREGNASWSVLNLLANYIQ